jgi:hypothetical protein
MANWTILFSLEGLFMVERRDMNNNPMIPIKTFDIVFLLFSKSILGICCLRSYPKELERGIRSIQYFGKKKSVSQGVFVGIIMRGNSIKQLGQRGYFLNLQVVMDFDTTDHTLCRRA